MISEWMRLRLESAMRASRWPLSPTPPVMRGHIQWSLARGRGLGSGKVWSLGSSSSYPERWRPFWPVTKKWSLALDLLTDSAWAFASFFPQAHLTFFWFVLQVFSDDPWCVLWQRFSHFPLCCPFRGPPACFTLYSTEKLASATAPITGPCAAAVVAQSNVACSFERGLLKTRHPSEAAPASAQRRLRGQSLIYLQTIGPCCTPAVLPRKSVLG